MSKKILFILGNFSPELTGIGKYNGEMVEWLARQGYTCTVITTFPYYPQWKVQEPYNKKWFWHKETVTINCHKYTIIRCPHYVPTYPTGAKRLLSDFSILFSTTVALLPYFFIRKYDYVTTVAPPFTLGLLGMVYKKLKGAKLNYHIQDLQIDAARDLGMVKSKPILNWMFKTERFILLGSDVVSTISPNMVKKVGEKSLKSVTFFPNWVDAKQFYPLKNKPILKLRFGFSPNDFIVMYSGAIGEKQGLEQIVEAARYFTQKPLLKFVICGSGPYKLQLQQLAKNNGLNNVHFLPLQPMEVFNDFLNMANVHLVLQKANAGDLMLPSKLSTILSVGGLTIVSAKYNTSLYNTITSANAGIIIPPGNEDALVDAINKAFNTDLSQKSSNARQYALDNLSIDSIISEFSSLAFN